MKHPSTRAERRFANCINSQDDFYKRWNLRIRVYSYTRYGWFKDKARRDYRIERDSVVQ